jgi:hypothetical protein
VKRASYRRHRQLIFFAATSFLFIFQIQPIRAAQSAGSPNTQNEDARHKKTAEAPGEPFVIERFLTHARFETDGTGRIDREAVVHLLTDSGVQQFSQLTFGYNARNQKLDVISVELRKDGSPTFTSASAVRDVAPLATSAPLYSDYHEKHITVPGLHAGDTLSYHVALITTASLAPGQFWFEHNFLRDAKVLDEQLEIVVPLNRMITLKTQPGADPKLTEEGDTRFYRWTHSHLPGDKDDAEKKRLAYSGQNIPDVQLTTFRSWEELGQWYSSFLSAPATPGSSLSEKAQELIKGHSTELEKIAAMYDFVATKFPSVDLPPDIGSSLPHSATEVLAAGYGDALDKHRLLAGLLDTQGIPEHPALIPSARVVDPDLPSLAQFDHLITVIPRSSERKNWLWLDTTAEVAPFRMLAAALRDKQALLIFTDRTASAGGKSALLVETPSDPPAIQNQKIEVTGAVNSAGKLSAHIHYSITGDSELALRLAFRHTPRESYTQLGKLLAAGDGFLGEISGVKSSDPLDTHKPFEVDYQISQANFLDVSQKKLQVRSPLPALGIPGAAENAGSHSIKLGSPLEVHIRATVEFPAGYAPTAPVPTNISRGYAAYRSNYSVKGSTIIATRDLLYHQRQIPVAQLEDYNAFAHAVRADEAQGVLVEAVAGGLDTSGAAKAK